MTIGEPTPERAQQALTEALDFKIEAMEIALARLRDVRQWQKLNPEAPARVVCMMVSAVRNIPCPPDLLP